MNAGAGFGIAVDRRTVAFLLAIVCLIVLLVAIRLEIPLPPGLGSPFNLAPT